MKLLFLTLCAIIGVLSVDYVNVSTTGQPPSARFIEACWIYNNLFYAYGGDITPGASANTANFQRGIHALDLTTNVWTLLNSTTTYVLANTNNAAVVVNGVAYIWAGSTANNPPNAFNNRMYIFTTYDLATGTFGTAPSNNTGNPFLLTSRGLTSAVRSPNGIAVFGGSQGTGTFFHDFYEYNIQAQSWTNLNANSTLIPSIRSASVSGVYKGVMYLFGGRDASVAGVLNDVWAYDFATGQWSLVNTTGTPPLPRIAATGVVTSDGVLIVFGGGSKAVASQYNDTFFLDLKTFTWTTVISTVPPTNRAYHCAAITQNDVMYIHGGGATAAVYGDLYTYAYPTPVIPTTNAGTTQGNGATQGTSATPQGSTATPQGSTATPQGSITVPVPNDAGTVGLMTGLAMFALALVF